MSVIAWDGITLAADKRASMDGLIRTTRKVFAARGCLLAYTGNASQGEEMLAWWKAGADPAKFPASQRDANDWAGLLVIEPGPRILKWERTPYPLTIEDEQFAAGSGRDFALAAMYCGKTAAEAVAVACHFESGCGNGVDTITLEMAAEAKD